MSLPSLCPRWYLVQRCGPVFQNNSRAPTALSDNIGMSFSVGAPKICEDCTFCHPMQGTAYWVTEMKRHCKYQGCWDRTARAKKRKERKNLERDGALFMRHTLEGIAYMSRTRARTMGCLSVLLCTATLIDQHALTHMGAVKQLLVSQMQPLVCIQISC